MLTVIPIPAFNDNYIWLILNPENHHAAVVDPGDATPVRAYCDQNNITLSAILITHHHPDHAGGVNELVKQYNTPVYGPAHEQIPHCNHPLTEGDSISIEALGISFDVIDIPGHTSGHIAFYGNGWLFCGDTLFSGGCGRIFEGTPPQMYDSLTKLKKLDPSTLVFCGHEYTVANLEFALAVEPNNTLLVKRMSDAKNTRKEGKPTLPSTIKLELDTNPFLRAHCDDIKAAAEDYSGTPLTSDVDVFAAIREKKNNF